MNQQEGDDREQDDNAFNQKEFMKDIERKRLLLKYKEENSSLRNQLKQLNERLNSMLVKQSNKLGQGNKLPTINALSGEEVLKKELENAYKTIEINRKQIKHYKQIYREDHHEKMKQLEDTIKQKQQEIENLTKENKNLLRLQKAPIIQKSEEEHSKIMVAKADELNAELARLRKMIREQEKEKVNREKEEIKKQQYIVTLEQKNRELLQQQQAKKPPAESPQKAANTGHEKSAATVTHMELTEENWNFMKQQFLELKEAKNVMESKLRNQNQTLKSKIQVLEKSLSLIRESRERGNRQAQTERNERKMSTIDVLPEASYSNARQLQPSQLSNFEENDKNYRVPANQRLNQSLQARHMGSLNSSSMELQSLQKYEWGKPVQRKFTDVKLFKENKDIIISGAVVWYTDCILGVRFLYKVGIKNLFTDEHVILRTKDYHKQQIDLGDGNYLQNLVLYEGDGGKLAGMTLISRDLKQFDVGKKTPRAIDLKIPSNHRPVYAFGSLGSIIDINRQQKSSVVCSLGLQTLVLV